MTISKLWTNSGDSHFSEPPGLFQNRIRCGAFLYLFPDVGRPVEAAAA